MTAQKTAAKETTNLCDTVFFEFKFNQNSNLNEGNGK